MLDIFKGKVVAKDWVFVGVVLAVTLALAVLFYLLVFRTEQGKVETKRTELADLTKELNEVKRVQKDIDKLREEYGQMSQLVERFEKRLPEEREIPTLLNRFERLGGELGLKVEMSTMPPKRENRVEVIPYKVTTRGQFHQITSFINLLERDDRYLKVSEIDIGEEEEGVSEATFVLSTFRFITEAEQEKAKETADAAKSDVKK